MKNVIFYLFLIFPSIFGQRDRERDNRQTLPNTPTSGTNTKDAIIHKYDFYLGEEGNFNFEFESSDGTARQEVATIEKTENEENLSVQGSYSFIDDTGKRHTVNYIADKDGFRVLEDDASAASSKITERTNPGPQSRPRF